MSIAYGRRAFAACLVLGAPLLAGCSQTTGVTEALTPTFVSRAVYGYTPQDKECLARAMFFESNRSSREGLVAVGTVVMNRKRSGQYADTICGVVGQKGQFAPGVMTRKMDSKALPDVMEAAEAVLKGERSPRLKNAMHFHVAGRRYPYKNMHYVLVAGGNTFYEKRGRNWAPLPDERQQTLMAAAPAAPAVPAMVAAAPAAPVLVASAAPIAPAVPPALAMSADTSATTAVSAQPGLMVAAAAPLPSLAPVPTRSPAAMIVAAAAFPPAPAVKVQALIPQSSPTTVARATLGGGLSPVQTSASSMALQGPTVSYEASPQAATAIGALLLNQNRPGLGF